MALVFLVVIWYVTLYKSIKDKLLVSILDILPNRTMTVAV